MSDFIIQIKKGKAKVGRIIDGELDSILFFGEVYISIEGFWDAFKKKIEYVDGETIALVIISDDKDFDVDPNISISKYFSNSDKDISLLIDSLTSSPDVIKSFPTIDLLPSSHELSKMVSVQPDIEQDDFFESDEYTEDSNLQSFYRKKTRDYKRG